MGLFLHFSKINRIVEVEVLRQASGPLLATLAVGLFLHFHLNGRRRFTSVLERQAIPVPSLAMRERGAAQLSLLDFATTVTPG